MFVQLNFTSLCKYYELLLYALFSSLKQTLINKFNQVETNSLSQKSIQ